MRASASRAAPRNCVPKPSRAPKDRRPAGAGGSDLPAALGGTVGALGTTVLVGALLAGVGTVGYQRGLKGQEELSVGGLAAGLLTLLIGSLVGGWAAGRMARSDGGCSGLMTAVWFLLLGAAVAALGAGAGRPYDVFDRLRLPRWFSANARTTTAVATGLVALTVTLVTGWFGGRLGGRYHRGPDGLIAATREGGISRTRRSAHIP